MSERDPLPDELAALFAAERSAPVGDTHAREQVRSRLAAIVPALPGKAAVGATLLSGTGKIIAIVAISIGVGVTAVGIAKQSPATSVPSAHIDVVAPEPLVTERVSDHIVQRDESEQTGSRSEPAPVIPLRVVEAPAEPPPSEATVIKNAWTALSSGDAKRTLDLADEAERLHPDGALVEEREALRIRALAKLGRVTEAASAAQKFFAQYPRSIHRNSIEYVIKADPP